LTGLRIEPAELVTTLRHGVTRFRITLKCYSARYASGKIPRDKAEHMRWLLPSEMDEYPLSTTGRKIARLSASKEPPE
jgi:A/G-specific adenine glycosylase